jgi:hypothetical protein
MDRLRPRPGGTARGRPYRAVRYLPTSDQSKSSSSVRDEIGVVRIICVPKRDPRDPRPRLRTPGRSRLATARSVRRENALGSYAGRPRVDYQLACGDGHQALAPRRRWLAAWRITGTEVDARNRSGRFPASQRVGSLQGRGQPAPPRRGCARPSVPRSSDISQRATSPRAPAASVTRSVWSELSASPRQIRVIRGDPRPVKQEIRADPRPVKQEIRADPRPVKQETHADPRPVKQEIRADPRPVKQRPAQIRVP